MKRCPQCEFIYEDDQSLCDMDGVLLVFDSRTLPHLHALATVPAPKSQRRNRAVPAFATLILALVLGMVYYVSTQRRTYTPTPETSTANPAPVLIPAPAPQETPAAVEASSPENTPKEEPKSAATKSPVKKATTTKTAVASQSKPSTTQKKDDSKVGSILKKTGRILKKPFKF